MTPRQARRDAIKLRGQCDVSPCFSSSVQSRSGRLALPRCQSRVHRTVAELAQAPPTNYDNLMKR